MTTIPYHKVQPEHRKHISNEMMQAKVGCKHCKGRGHNGVNVKTGLHVPCRCVLVNVDMLAELMTEKFRELEKDQPQTEASHGD